MMNEVDWWCLETQHSDTVTRDELKTSLAAAIARAEATEKRVQELEAKLAALEGWEVPDGVEYPVGRVDVLVVREAVWRDGIEEWEDTRSDLYLHDVIAYRDKPRGDSGE